MRRHPILFLALALLLAMPAWLRAQAQEKAALKVITLSTTSTESKDQFEAAVFNAWSGYGARGAQRMRDALAKDPSFVAGRALLALLTADNAGLNKAAGELGNATLGEQLLAVIWRERASQRQPNALAIAKA